ncbi:UPF0503 protein, chloroplastic-like isoform X1 [Canna indica]|uniref:UPF0503 protein, chloroplastic-like isoform X1 n=1 Tax=Canna indica TaxID=4628 RepID=A0AAQ3L6R0_9LILI|nr:UPF0503 protein, chloroplastic-like isoform X1 [Canna indica]
MDLDIGPPPPPPPPWNHPHRLPPSTCDLHPDETVTGFCASCLRERLAGLDTAPGRRSTSSVSALRSVFARVSASNAPSFLRPELRRCKSFSFARRASASALEPERKSCDVRGRYTLWSLFRQDDMDSGQQCLASSSATDAAAVPAALQAVAGGGIEAECRNLGFPPSSSSVAPTLQTRDEEDDTDEIRVVEPVLEVGTSLEMDVGERVEETEVKPMKEHIDHDVQEKKPPSKDLKEIAGSFWLAASVFSKKLQKWRRKQKDKKQVGKAAAAAMPSNKPPKSSRRLRDTQSEVAIDAFGRRSCDTDPRFSLDAGRMSLDDPRFSLDEPRASWDGYLIGGRSVFARLPPMHSVVEDAPAPAPAVLRSDGLIPVEEDAATPGGSAQTRDYYLDSSSSRRRRSLDRSNSNSTRELPVEFNELRPLSNAKVSPAGGSEFFHFHHVNLLDRDTRDLSSKSLRDEYFGSLDASFRDLREGTTTKKPRKWGKAWNIWGFIQRKSSNRDEANVVDRSFSESWPGLRSQGYNGRILRSNSNVSSRSAFSGNGSSYRGMRRSILETNAHTRKRREELALERNRSARYSPTHSDNGMLRFYLTPMRNSRRNGGSGKARQINSQYFVRNMLGLY